ncbi:AAA family ATPase [Bradyrhizobium sp. SZCCHNRI3043]|uniref:AAA family ATPase n=1 Tax=Bradyrhizobium sp. SZCCHNRI3043 TaxID=3057292 RepID=UPI0028E6A44C|nr:AAA family ATPase [Bradyrhizobium sp. SZCCHNRI3043]
MSRNGRFTHFVEDIPRDPPQRDDDTPLGEWDAGDDEGVIPPREWLLGNAFCRGFVSSLLGEGGSGKTALRLVQYLAVVTGRPLSEEYVFTRSKVMLLSLEDSRDELRRRLRAACLHYGIAQSELKGRLFVRTASADLGKIMMVDPAKGALMLGKLAGKIERAIRERGIALVALDPFVKVHSVGESDNSAIDQVMQVLADMAIALNVAVDTPHHISKGPADPGNANRGRGASSMKDAARLVFTLTRMSPEEAQAFGVSEAQRQFLVRLDSGKVNIAPPMTEAKWFRLVSVSLDNGTDLYPSGDQVQTVEPWTPPQTFSGISNGTLNEILSEIDTGLPDGNRFTDAPNVRDRAAWRVVEKHCPTKSEGTCREIIKTWLRSGLLFRRDYTNPVTHKRVKGLVVDNEKRPSKGD